MMLHHRSTTARRDRGFSLPELLIAMTVSGILVSALAMAFSVIVRSQAGSQQRIAESKDVTFVQTWLPTDLSSATQTWIEPVVPFPFNADLPGTNVLTMARPDLETGGAYLIMYRYEELEGRGWIMARYRVDNPGCPTAYPVVGNCDAGAEAVKRIGVAYELVRRRPIGLPTRHRPTPSRSRAATAAARTGPARPAGPSVRTSRCTSRAARSTSLVAPDCRPASDRPEPAGDPRPRRSSESLRPPHPDPRRPVGVDQHVSGAIRPCRAP